MGHFNFYRLADISEALMADFCLRVKTNQSDSRTQVTQVTSSALSYHNYTDQCTQIPLRVAFLAFRCGKIKKNISRRELGSQPTGWFEFIFNTVDKQSDKLLSILLMQSNSVEMNVFHSTPSLAIYNCHFDQIRHVWTVKSGVKYYYKILDFINCHLSTLGLINKRLHYSSDTWIFPWEYSRLTKQALIK